MPIGYLIDSREKIVIEVVFDRLRDMQAVVGGRIQLAYDWPTGDTLYIDEDAMSRHPKHFFALPTCRPDQGFAGCGLVVGPEIMAESYPDGYTHLPPRMSREDLEALVYWVALGG
jgi:hypothetical protein